MARHRSTTQQPPSRPRAALPMRSQRSAGRQEVLSRRQRGRERSARPLAAAAAVLMAAGVALGFLVGVDGAGRPRSGDGPARLGAAPIDLGPPNEPGSTSSPGAVDGTGDGDRADGTRTGGSPSRRGSGSAEPGSASPPAGDTSSGTSADQASPSQASPSQGTRTGRGAGAAQGSSAGRSGVSPGAAGGLAGGSLPTPVRTPSAGPTTQGTATQGTATTQSGTRTQAGTGTQSGTGGDEVSLLWSDEFDGAAGAAPDPRVWSAQTGYGWGDREMQCYTTDPRNLSTDGRGNLVISALREPSCGGASYSSGRIETLGKRTMRYGYLEVRAVLPTGKGAFPAVWMLGADMPTVGWPASGELDVVEAVSTAPTTVHTNVHGVDAAGAHWQATWGHGGMYDAQVDLAAGFHTYGLEWTSAMLRFYFDGRLIRTVTRDQVPVWLWDRENYVILNVAVNRLGEQATAADYPQRMIVDYLRVFSARP